MDFIVYNFNGEPGITIHFITFSSSFYPLDNPIPTGSSYTYGIKMYPNGVVESINIINSESSSQGQTLLPIPIDVGDDYEAFSPNISWKASNYVLNSVYENIQSVLLVPVNNINETLYLYFAPRDFV